MKYASLNVKMCEGEGHYEAHTKEGLVDGLAVRSVHTWQGASAADDVKYAKVRFALHD
jgi:hypothetical protein